MIQILSEAKDPRHKFAVAVSLALALIACRTARPVGEQPITTLAPPAHFTGQRSVVRIRMMNGTQTQSVRAQLQVGADGDMLITAYAPVINTSAVRLYAANGQIVFLNDIDKTAWQGKAGDFTGSFGFIGSNPAALAFLILGIPPKDATSVEFAGQVLQAARLQDLVVAYDPPVYPPRKVVVVRGVQRVEIDHLEDYASPAPIAPLTVPGDYRCCVLPQL